MRNLAFACTLAVALAPLVACAAPRAEAAQRSVQESAAMVRTRDARATSGSSLPPAETPAAAESPPIGVPPTNDQPRQLDGSSPTGDVQRRWPY